MRSKIKELILSMAGCVPLLKYDMGDIWKEQRKHLHCIQYPPGFQLYAQVGEVVKGGVTLPLYRCARGSTSVESFHHHLLNFIPGTSANYVHFQAYLLEGHCRWNALRKDPLISSPLSSVRSFNVEMIDKFNLLHSKVHGDVYNHQSLPNKYTGESIGLELMKIISIQHRLLMLRRRRRIKRNGLGIQICSYQ